MKRSCVFVFELIRMSGWDDLFALAAGEGEEERNDSQESLVLTKQNDVESIKDNDNERIEPRFENDSRQPKKKKKKKHHYRKASHQQCLEILSSRMQVPNMDESNSSFWPPWMKSDSTLFIQKSHASKNNSLEMKEEIPLSPLYHTIRLSDDAEESISPTWKNVLNLFLTIRNIRASCSCIIDILYSFSQHQQSINIITTIQSYTLSSHHKSQHLQSLLNNIITSTSLFTSTSQQQQSGEGQLLNEKCRKLLQSAQRLHSKAQKLKPVTNNKNRNNKIPDKSNKPTRQSILFQIFEEIITLIIDCDAFYFRLYYLQITHLLPLSEVYNHHNTNNEQNSHYESATAISTKIAFIPHPSTYFGVPFMSWDIQQGLIYVQDIIKQFINEFGIHTKVSSPTMTKQNVLKLLSKLPENAKKSQLYFMMETAAKINFVKNDDGTISICNHDPLSFLHNNRLLEGLLLFHKSGWFLSHRVSEQTFQSLKTHHQRLDIGNHDTSINTEEDLFYARHETPAPSILMHWRDSCRDFLCNLYAYATLAPSTIHQINKFCENNDISGGLVEVGAGTGFVADLLRRSGINVHAWDVSPPSSTSNDYHGETPSFSTVRKGDVDDALKSHFNNCKSNQKAELSALLLCYPPPNSDMAYRAVKLFSKFGGRYIIHIGEFKGLTGSKKFETFLKTSFVCKDRYPCLEWGNDASNVTIWFRKEKSKNKNNNYDQNDIMRDSSNKPKTVLLPCSYCHQNESIRRYRLSRSIVYCSLKCFHSHKTLRNQLLQFHFINVVDKSGNDQIEFQNDQHFMKLI